MKLSKADTPLFEALLRDPEQVGALRDFMEERDLHPDSLVGDGRDLPALCAALSAGNNEGAKLLIGMGADVDKYPPRPFFPGTSYAGLPPVSFANLEGIRLLAEAGANLDAPLTAGATKGNTVLTRAAALGNIDKANALIAAGADPDREIVAWEGGNVRGHTGGMTAAEQLKIYQESVVAEVPSKTVYVAPEPFDGEDADDLGLDASLLAEISGEPMVPSVAAVPSVASIPAPQVEPAAELGGEPEAGAVLDADAAPDLPAADAVVAVEEVAEAAPATVAVEGASAEVGQPGADVELLAQAEFGPGQADTVMEAANDEGPLPSASADGVALATSEPVAEALAASVVEPGDAATAPASVSADEVPSPEPAAVSGGPSVVVTTAPAALAAAAPSAAASKMVFDERLAQQRDEARGALEQMALVNPEALRDTAMKLLGAQDVARFEEENLVRARQRSAAAEPAPATATAERSGIGALVDGVGRGVGSVVSGVGSAVGAGLALAAGKLKAQPDASLSGGPSASVSGSTASATSSPPVVMPRISDYRVSAVEKVVSEFEDAQSQLWSASPKLATVKAEIDRLAKERGVPASDVTAQMVPGGPLEDLRKTFDEGMAETPDAAAYKREMERSFKSFGKQYAVAQRDMADPDQRGPLFDALSERVKTAEERMAKATEAVPAFKNEDGGLDATFRERLREQIAKVMEAIREFLHKITAALRGSDAEAQSAPAP